MAIASGTATPPVYLLDQEEGINAFAAGLTPQDAVIGVTRGTATTLNRDELQGVIAHEFSHILNGDMRLNVRLIGLLHGILIIGMIGYFGPEDVVLHRRRTIERQQGRPACPGDRRRARGHRFRRHVLRQPDQGRGQPAAGVPGGRLGRAVHAAAFRYRRGAQEDRRLRDRLGGQEPERTAGEPHVLSAARPPASTRCSRPIRRSRSGSGASDPAWDGEFPELDAGGVGAAPCRGGRRAGRCGLRRGRSRCRGRGRHECRGRRQPRRATDPRAHRVRRGPDRAPARAGCRGCPRALRRPRGGLRARARP